MIIRIKICIGLLFVLVISNHSQAANWSRFITTKSRDDVSISFRQKKNNNAWTVEWQVENNSEEIVEPIIISRHYLCRDDNSQKLGEKSLGTYFPGTHRHGDLKDFKICPNSKIKLVEIETEIHEVSQTPSIQYLDQANISTKTP